MDKKNDALVASSKMKYGGRDVEISIYAPELAFPDSDQYSCKFYIIGGGIDYAGYSIGYDSMQSLILSLKKIGTYLEKSDNIDQSLISWIGGEMEFPVFNI